MPAQSNDTNIPKLRFPEFTGEWSNKKIGQILTIGSGRDYKHLNDGNIPVYGTGGYMTSVDDYLYDGESVCIGRKGTIDKPVYLTGKFWTVDTLFYTHKFIDSLPLFVFGLFQKIDWKIHNEASGVPSLSKTTIEKIKINIPKKEEQQKIASFLGAVDDKIAGLQKKKDLLEAYKKGMMQRLFSQSLRFTDTNGNPFPYWEEKKLGGIAEIITGKTPSTTDNSLWDGSIQFITPTDIDDETRYVESTPRHVSETKGMKVLPPQTICYTCIASIGKICLTKYPAITNQQINSAIVKKANNPLYVFYALKHITPKIKALQANTTLPIINKTEFSKILLSIPHHDEQQKIADFLSAIDDKIALVADELTHAKTFKKGLLQQMFV